MGSVPRARGTEVLVVLLLSTGACGGGAGGGEDVPPVYTVAIDPVETPTTHAQVELLGVATCDACPPSETLFGTCPPVQGPFSSEIRIQWTNRTTGESGDAGHGIYGRRSWFFSYCTVFYSHRWFATVPLAFGPNELEVVALGPSRNPGRDEVTVTRLPAAPGNLVAQPRQTDVLLTWDPVPGVEAYELLWADDPDLDEATAHLVPGVTSPHADAAVPDRVRYYAVRAVAFGYEGPLSEEAFAVPGWIPQSLPLPSKQTTATEATLAVDSAGGAHVHVSRLGTAASPWIENDYATNATGTWTSLPVGHVSDLVADVAVGPDDTVHVTYVEGAGLHGVRAGGAWDVEPFDADASCYTSLAVDPTGRVHVLYQENRLSPDPTGRVRYATDAGGSWASVVVDATRFGCYQEGSKLSLAVGPNARAHALYLAGPSRDGLRYASDETGAWTAEDVSTEYVRSLALALDPPGTPHAVWTDGSGVLRHGTRLAPGTWLAETVDEFAFGPSLAIAPGGELHVSYFQYARGELRYARKADEVWRILPIAPASFGPTALALDAQEGVHIAWTDGEVRYVSRR